MRSQSLGKASVVFWIFSSLKDGFYGNLPYAPKSVADLMWIKLANYAL